MEVSWIPPNISVRSPENYAVAVIGSGDPEVREIFFIIYRGYVKK
jgi:hypothetical protein